jgi:uncharacterized RDD family membrane protein YckC
MNTQAHNYIGFWSRFGATIIDTILLCIVLYPPLILIYGWEYFDLDQTSFIAGPADFIISWIIPFILILVFWIQKQATPGKMLVHAKIIDAKTGEKPTLRQWIIRYIGYFLGAIPLGLGYFWVAFDARKQGWHDKMAGTIVVRT